MTRAWAPNGYDTVEWPAGHGFALADREWFCSRASTVKWRNPQVRQNILDGMRRAAQAKRDQAAEGSAP